MKSVADLARDEMVERVRQMTPAQRVELTARLAADDARLFAAARRIDEGTARRLLARQRQIGRRPSGAIDALLCE
jgi:hypothetical protein